MSTLPRLFASLRYLTRQTPRAINPECFDLREWADLPTHHPRCR